MKKKWLILPILFCLLLNIIPVKASQRTGVIFLGDSRTVGIQNNVNLKDNEFIVAKVGAGYSWLTQTGISQVEKITSKYTSVDKWTIFVNLGVNDLYNCDEYLNKYKELKQTKWKKHNIIYVSVNPVDTDLMTTYGYNKLYNEDIDQFNYKLSRLGNYINTNDSLTFRFSDGLHYTADTYLKIYKHCNNYLSEGRWIEDKSKWWYLYNDETYPINQWCYINNNWYYFDNHGYMSTGWIKWKDEWYYLYSNGVMAKNTNLYGYRFDSSGVAYKI